MDIAVTRELAQALDRAAGDDTQRVVVLKGHSHGFGAGSDLKALAGQDTAGMIADEREMAALARSFNQHPKPVVAAVDGYAIGGGAVYAASCDVVFTSADAIWALPEVSIGWNAAYGFAAMQARMGPVTARHVLWGVDRFSGRDAWRFGLADFLARKDAAEEARSYAERLASLPSHAVRAVKRLTAPAVGEGAGFLDDLAMAEFSGSLGTESAQATLHRFGMGQG